MKIGYFCYRLSGTGPRTRAADIINGVADITDHEVIVLTNEPEKVRSEATVQTLSLDNPLKTLLRTRRAFADADVVHVPINIYQVLFTRLVYWGPLVAGVGPGIQNSLFHRLFGRLLGIDIKIQKEADETQWERLGYETANVLATIDRSQFYQYEDKRIQQLRTEHGIEADETVMLYVGALTEGQGAHIFDQMARQTENERHRFIVAGAGPLKERFESHDNLTFEGFVDNKVMPALYNVADITVAPRKYDVTSNVGLESLACGTPVITTATGKIERLFKNRGTYVWADRTPAAVLRTATELVSDPDRYQAQVEQGFQAFDEMELTLNSAVETHLDVYERLSS
ncbi:glycosyltransferase family 4 protein [Haloarcula laminariae]|uniref:glycosyltransferase family 4 protein n=1 Tax=Haloarcula laminariae TaxID=2961577 RepID=UPI0021C5E82F|nr:glycosyltransferase family 4 protein [Halomicroarcula laminariae]